MDVYFLSTSLKLANKPYLFQQKQRERPSKVNNEFAVAPRLLFYQIRIFFIALYNYFSPTSTPQKSVQTQKVYIGQIELFCPTIKHVILKKATSKTPQHGH